MSRPFARFAGCNMSKEKNCLVTADLISSIEWCQTAPDTPADKSDPKGQTWSEKAFTDLQDKLNRVYSDMPIAAKHGIDFENRLYNTIRFRPDLETLEASDEFKNLCRFLNGFNFQTKKSTLLNVDGNECFLYGKFDAFADGRPIVDIKTTANYKRSKYENAFQHDLYMYIADYPEFIYKVVEWLEYPKINKVETIVLSAPDNLETVIKNRISDAFAFLEDVDLWGTYREKYCLY